MKTGVKRRHFMKMAAAGVAVGMGANSVSARRQESKTHRVEMISEGGEFYFDPIGLHIKPGDTVVFVNKSGSHSTTAFKDRIPEGADAWDSGILSEQGAEFEVTFETEGTYDYFCTPHKSLGMIGRIVVGKPGGPAEQGKIPQLDKVKTGTVPSSKTIQEKGSVSYPYQKAGGDGGNGGGSREPKTVEVSMTSDNIFDPIGVYIQPGDTIRWVNEGGSHSAKAYKDRIPEGAKAFNTGVYSEGESREVTFKTEGTYDYFCTPHKSLGMIGRIVVGKPGGPAEQGKIPDKPPEGRVPSGKTIQKQGKLSYPFTGVSQGDGGGGSVSGPPSGIPGNLKNIGLGVIGVFTLGLAHIYGFMRYGKNMSSAKAAGTISVYLGLLFILAIAAKLLGFI